MIEVQCICACLDRKDFSYLRLNDVTADYFENYKTEYQFIEDHVTKFGNVPDVATFLNKFPDFVMVEVAESERYLIDQLRENYVYNSSAKILQEVSKKFKTVDSREAVAYLLSKMPEFNKKLSFEAVELISQYNKRYEKYLERMENPENAFVTTGEAELDEILGGGIADNENVLLVASTGQGKSWWAIRLGEAAVKAGRTVGYYSGEMAAEDVGYRLDTVHSHISNFAITRGLRGVNEKYKEVLLKTQKEVPGKFYVVTPEDLNGAATVAKLEAFVEKYKIDYLIVDQASLLQDSHRTQNSFDSHRNLARDLNLLRTRKKIRLVVINQLNRDAKKKDVSDPDTQHVAGSNAYSEYATLMLSVKQIYPSTLELRVGKHRSAPTGSKLVYSWKIDTFDLTYVKTEDDALHVNQISELRKSEGMEKGKELYNDNYDKGKDVF